MANFILRALSGSSMFEPAPDGREKIPWPIELSGTWYAADQTQGQPNNRRHITLYLQGANQFLRSMITIDTLFTGAISGLNVNSDLVIEYYLQTIDSTPNTFSFSLACKSCTVQPLPAPPAPNTFIDCPAQGCPSGGNMTLNVISPVELRDDGGLSYGRKIPWPS